MSVSQSVTKISASTIAVALALDERSSHQTAVFLLALYEHSQREPLPSVLQDGLEQLQDTLVRCVQERQCKLQALQELVEKQNRAHQDHSPDTLTPFWAEAFGLEKG